MKAHCHLLYAILIGIAFIGSAQAGGYGQKDVKPPPPKEAPPPPPAPEAKVTKSKPTPPIHP
jgi:hypothetical protein